MRGTCIGTTVAAAALIISGQAQGQLLVDTFRQLRSTVHQLGGHSPKSATPTASGGSSVDAGHGSPGDESFVSASLLAADTSDTSLAANPVVPRRVASFDVRGVKLGMSVREVARVAGGQGFRHRWNQLLLTSGTFDDEAARFANAGLANQLKTGGERQIKSVQGADGAGDELTCEFTLEPAGPRVSRILYVAALDGTTPDQALAHLATKFGPPNGHYDTPWQHSWTNAKGPLDGSSPSMSANIDGGKMMLILNQSTDYLNSARKLLVERAAKLSAAHGGGVRF